MEQITLIYLENNDADCKSSTKNPSLISVHSSVSKKKTVDMQLFFRFSFIFRRIFRLSSLFFFTNFIRFLHKLRQKKFKKTVVVRRK